MSSSDLVGSQRGGNLGRLEQLEREDEACSFVSKVREIVREWKIAEVIYH